MAEPIRVNTDSFIGKGKVDIDGNIWDVKLPGAGTELRFSQASRKAKSLAARIELIDKKIDAGTHTEEDLNTYDAAVKDYEVNETIVYDLLFNMFSDGTPENTAVKKWADETPLAIIMLVFEDIKKQVAANDSTGATASP